MKPATTLLTLMLVALLAGCPGSAPGHGAAADPDARVTRLAPDSAAQVRAMTAFGLNLGHATQWGAEQLLANVLHNPGFEGITDGSLITAGSISGEWIDDAAAWAARPAGFWQGARFEVRTGPAAGRSGRVTAHEGTPGQGQRLKLDTPVPTLARGDIIALLRDDDPTAAPLWWREAGEFRSVATPRPGSPGKLAVQVTARGAPARLSHYLDGITDRSGTLLPIQGHWRLTLWARSDGPQPVRLQARFGRSGHPAFLDTQALVGLQWQRLEWDFTADDAGASGPLALTLSLPGGSVVLDDASLEAIGAATAGGFRPEVVAALAALKPGVLRDWQGQLGAPLANRLAPPLARQPARYRAGEHEAQHHYGLEEFLALCAQVGARPWIVGAPTWSDREWAHLGGWLTAALDRHGLAGAIVEFGNENWNPVFRPAAIESIAALGQVSERAFLAVHRGAGHDARILTTLGGQSARAGHARELAIASPASRSIALGPYFGYEARAGETTQAMLARWFDEPFDTASQQLQDIRQAGRVPVIYEVNLHTTEGDDRTAARNAAVTSAQAGVLLARQLLRGVLAGADYQAVYALAGFDTQASTVAGMPGTLVRLFGVTRDLSSATPRLMPTGYALAMLNGIARRSVRPARCEGTACDALVTAYFDGSRSVAIVSSSAQAQSVRVQLACGEGERVDVSSYPPAGPPAHEVCRAQGVRITIAARSIVTLAAATAPN